MLENSLEYIQCSKPMKKEEKEIKNSYDVFFSGLRVDTNIIWILVTEDR